MANEQMKKWIANASYAQLLYKWRFAPVGDPFFMDEVGQYYEDVMRLRRNEIGDAEHVKISKYIGWER